MANYGKRMVSEVDIAQIGQGGSGEYTAGTGIDITEDVISVDNTVAMKTDLPAAVSGTNDGTNWTSLTIGDTTKNIPSGGGSATLYRHSLYIKNKSSYNTTTYIRCEFINTDSTEYNTANISAFITYISTRFTDTVQALTAQGAIRDITNNTDLPVTGLIYYNSALYAVSNLHYGTDEFSIGIYSEDRDQMTIDNYRFYDNVTTV